MQSILTVIFCCVCYVVTTQAAANIVPTTPVSPAKSNWKEFATSHQAFKESTKSKRDKFSCVLNLLKYALAEELQNSNHNFDNTAQDNASSTKMIEEKKSFENIENQLEKPILRDEIETDGQNANQKMVMQTTSELSNITSEQKNIEMPNMIPIFKPRPRPVNELNQNVADLSYTTRQGPTSKAIAFVPEKIIQTVMSPMSSQTESNQNMADSSSTPFTDTRHIQKSRAVSFVPENIIQANMSPVPKQAMFNIPCQRAADVLDMSIMAPKDAACRNTNVNPIADTTKPIYPNQISAPINYADEDDTVAMLFKPKNISLKQVYGNLLKKVTITVLVPYHMSKLGGKQNF